MPYFRAHFKQRIGSHSVVERYFSPPSGAIATITPLSISLAFFNASTELVGTAAVSCEMAAAGLGLLVTWHDSQHKTLNKIGAIIFIL